MDENPEAGGAPRWPKEPKLEDKEQCERFIETARELGADEGQQGFEAAFEKIILKKNSNNPDRQG
jgi:hypothetical protein